VHGLEDDSSECDEAPFEIDAVLAELEVNLGRGDTDVVHERAGAREDVGKGGARRAVVVGGPDDPGSVAKRREDDKGVSQDGLDGVVLFHVDAKNGQQHDGGDEVGVGPSSIEAAFHRGVHGVLDILQDDKELLVVSSEVACVYNVHQDGHEGLAGLGDGIVQGYVTYHVEIAGIKLRRFIYAG